ncbi:type VII secretion protein EccCb [Mycobacterium sp. M1]|uniref:Type VII secretion protein EccCb n=1 Tax=Mycolicibacter acidiphilus TaxID=2835306 RepID=A0ABS5RSP9_9MYCO|nr:type VII secretion protein EccCb [Mycolicibacter acidiphilus]MBS9535984.1 type VII secretion protein EccCb [Mycolicibacter acidiphilus]
MVEVAASVAKGLGFAATPDVMSLAEAEVLARALARFEVSDDAALLLANRAADARAGQDFLDTFDIEDARTWHPELLWSKMTSTSPERLRIPLGKNPHTGKLVWLDLKEFADHNGQGPHGMMTGYTGSGKSETLTTFVLGLAMLHSPAQVQLLLGDFKGESAMRVLAPLPHVQGLVSNLEASVHMLDRLEEAVQGEVLRREELVKAAGYGSVRDYERARATTQPGLEPIGALVVVLDEFSELLRMRPSTAEVFDTVGRVGRALWIHILNASQRVEIGKMQGLIAQQTYSIGLKVKDNGASRAAIGTNRAYEDLKGAPAGSGFLVVDDDHYRFRSFYVSAPFIAPVAGGAQRRETEGQIIDAHRFTAAVHPLPLDIAVKEDEAPVAAQPVDDVTVDSKKVVEVLVDRMVGVADQYPLPHRLWLPPLEEIDQIGVDEMAEEFWGRDWREVTDNSGLVVPIGRIDEPFKHTQALTTVDLSGAGGNVAVMGATQSGKSTVLRTLMMMLAVSHSPARVQFYAVDLGGGKLSSVEGLPHVCGIARQGDEEKIRRIFAEVERLLKFRTKQWGLAGIDLTEFRARKFRGKAGEVPDDGHGDVFFLIDNYRVIADDLELSDRVNTLVTTALNYGIHLVITHDSWYSIKEQVLNKLGTKIELRMAKGADSTMKDKEAAEAIPREQPGRALALGGKHMLLGAPVADGRRMAGGDEAHGESEQDAVAATAAQIAQLWQAKGVAPAPRLPVLPGEVHFDDLEPAPTGTIAFGVGEAEMSTVGMNLVEGPHLYIVGSNHSGRSTVLRTALAAIAQTFTPDQARVVLMDPGFELSEAIDPAYRAAYAGSPAEVGELATNLAARLAQRRPPADLPAEALARWRFPGERVFLVIDDMNLLTATGMGGSAQSVLTPLVSVVERGRQIGLHVIAATSVHNWATNGTMNKLIQAMGTAGSGVLILDGPPEKIVDGIKAAPRAPGRGELVYRRAGRQLMQVALPPGYDPAAADRAQVSW